MRMDEFWIHPECSPPLVNASHFYAAPKRSNGMSQRHIPADMRHKTGCGITSIYAESGITEARRRCGRRRDCGS